MSYLTSLPASRANPSWLLVLATAAIAGCGGEAASAPGVPTQAATAVEPPLVNVTPVSVATWGESVRVHGTLLPDESATLGCKVAGRIASMMVDVGDIVRQGQPIAKLDEVQLRLEVKHAEALLAQACAAIGLDPREPSSSVNPENSPVVRQERALVDQARLNLDRAQTLKRQGVTTQEELDQREAEYKVATARYSSALNNVAEKIATIEVRRSEVDLAKNAVAESTIVAPFDGVVEERSTAAGAYVRAGDPVVSMVRCDKVRYLGAVPEKHSYKVSIGQQVHIHLASREAPIAVRISRLRPQIDLSSRAMLFEADVANPDLVLRPGSFAEADVLVDSQTPTVVAPATAVVEFAGVEKVWRVIDGEAKEATVRTGPKREGQVAIESGLQAGDLIITDGHQGQAGKVRVENMPASALTSPAVTQASSEVAP